MVTIQIHIVYISKCPPDTSWNRTYYENPKGKYQWIGLNTKPCMWCKWITKYIARNVYTKGG